MTSPADILRELVAIPTVSSLSNRLVISFLADYFGSLGWHKRELSYRDSNEVEKVNLIVSPWSFEDGPVHARLALVCHTDTVPYSSGWAYATVLQEKDGMLHGCGACDVKGFMACMLAAAEKVDTSALQQRLVFVFTSDEEIGCRGARFLHEQKALQPQYAIVGEPTSLRPSRAGKGYCLAEINVRGRSAHSAYPAEGASAIFAAADLLTKVEKLSRELERDQDDFFSPPWTTLNVGTIRGGAAKNMVPAECSFLVEWRPIPSQAPGVVADRLRSLIAESARESISVELSVLRTDAGFETPEDSAVLEAVMSKAGPDSQAVPFGTEAPYLSRMGADAIVIGPGSMLTAHSPRECVPRRELDDCVKLLGTAIERLCGTAG